MSRTAAAKPLTEEEQLTNALGTAIVNRDTEQLSAAVNELGKKYTTPELEAFWKDINSDLTAEDVSWLKTNLMGQDIKEEPIQPLSQKERKRLSKLEGIIEDGFKSVENVQLKVGEALAEIDKAKLWRETHQSFQAYCEDQARWQYRFGYKRAKQLTSAAQVRQTIEVSTEVELNEKVLRELGREKDLEKRQQIVETALQENAVLTEPIIRQIRERITPPATREPKALPGSKLTVEVGDLVSIDNPESVHADKWGRLDSIAPDSKRVKVRIGASLIVFDSDEVQLERMVPPAIASRVEELCKSVHPHVREIATTFCSHHEFEQWQQDLLDYLDKVS